MTFQRGTLWQSIERTTEQALRTGALVPIPTNEAVIEDAGIRFFVRVLAGLRRKDEARREQEAAAAKGERPNPFLPPEKDLVVAGVSDTHLAILNKFNVVEHHLLIVTRDFEDQEMLLTLADFEALWLVLAEYDGLGFYNGGSEGGASQKHKHLQVVPLPLAATGPAVPVEPLLAAWTGRMPGTVPGYPFLHRFARLEPEIWRSPRDAALASFELYCAMLAGTGMNVPCGPGLTRQSRPYCLLVTREWMLLVPRTAEHFESISLNSLAYAGSFFVRDETELARLREAGPMQALRSVSFGKEG